MLPSHRRAITDIQGCHRSARRAQRAARRSVASLRAFALDPTALHAAVSLRISTLAQKARMRSGAKPQQFSAQLPMFCGELWH